jgi:hypothetical protein
MAPRPLNPRGLPTASCAPIIAKECLAALELSRSRPELEADTHNRIADDAGTTVCVDHETASTPFVLALRAPGAAC